MFICLTSKSFLCCRRRNQTVPLSHLIHPNREVPNLSMQQDLRSSDPKRFSFLWDTRFRLQVDRLESEMIFVRPSAVVFGDGVWFVHRSGRRADMMAAYRMALRAVIRKMVKLAKKVTSRHLCHVHIWVCDVSHFSNHFFMRMNFKTNIALHASKAHICQEYKFKGFLPYA
jgi:hypothetical protein